MLPARLKEEMAELKEAVLSGKDLRREDTLAKHAGWVEEFLPKYENVGEENIDDIINHEIGLVFSQVLEDAGVYKCTTQGREAFLRFVKSV